MTQLPKRKGWDGQRRAAPYAGPDPFELSRQRAEEDLPPAKALSKRGGFAGLAGDPIAREGRLIGGKRSDGF